MCLIGPFSVCRAWHIHTDRPTGVAWASHKVG
jgi:hypothetical protein